MLQSFFNTVARRVAYTFALNLYTNVVGWLAAGYGYFAITSILSESEVHLGVFARALLVCLVLVTVASFVHHGALRSIGMPGLGRKVRLLNRWLDGRSLTEISNETIRPLYEAVERAPVIMFHSAGFYSTLVIIGAVGAHYLASGSVFESAVIAAGGVVATLILTYFAYIMVESLTGSNRSDIARELARRGLPVEMRAVLSLRLKFLLLVGLFLLSMMLLALYVLYRPRAEPERVVAFILLTVLATALLTFLLQASVRDALKRIIGAARDLAQGGPGTLYPASRDQEVAVFAEHYNHAAAEAAATREDLARTREMYRLLFEGDRDIVLSLDSELRILMANQALNRTLGWKPRTVIERSFFDLVAFEGVTEELLVRSRLTQELARGDSFRERLSLRARHSGPRRFDLRIEPVTTASAGQVLVRATPASLDRLPANLRREEAVYILENDLTRVKDLADELVRNLGAFFDEDALMGLSFGIREMMTNAIEHGNLAIGYEEKTRAMSENAYLELLANRRGDPRFSDRRVTVQYRLVEDRVEFEIEDQGSGFDTGILRDPRTSGPCRKFQYRRAI